MLKSQDKVHVYSTTNMIPKQSVIISGGTSASGKYILKEDMTLYDLLFRSGIYNDDIDMINSTYLKVERNSFDKVSVAK